MPISESDYSYDEATNDHYDLDHQHAAPTSTTQNTNRMMSKAELRKVIIYKSFFENCRSMIMTSDSIYGEQNGTTLKRNLIVLMLWDAESASDREGEKAQQKIRCITS